MNAVQAWWTVTGIVAVSVTPRPNNFAVADSSESGRIHRCGGHRRRCDFRNDHAVESGDGHLGGL